MHRGERHFGEIDRVVRPEHVEVVVRRIQRLRHTVIHTCSHCGLVALWTRQFLHQRCMQTRHTLCVDQGAK